MIRWDDLNPVYADFETQSAADLRAVGGRLYAAHRSTRIMSLVCLIDDRFHVWFPTLPEPINVPDADLIPLAAYRIPPGAVAVYGGFQLPDPIRDAARSGRTFVGHNVFGFDRFIWERFLPEHPVAAWADTLPLARASGYPGALDAFATATLASGKDAGQKIAKKLFTAKETPQGTIYPPILKGMVGPLLRYNLVDVLLVAQIWYRFADREIEADVFAAHVAVNDRGCHVDQSLLDKLQRVGVESTTHAADEISELTGGILHSGNMRSVQQVHAWLKTKGIRIINNEGKQTLRKDVVDQALANPALMLDPDSGYVADGNVPPEVFDVLRLRSSAIRITGAKAERAAARVGMDGRVRDMFTYHQAHTGRWSSQGVQVHNLPRPKKGVPVGRMLSGHETQDRRGEGFDAPKTYRMIRRSLRGTRLKVDDALSALVRSCLTAAPGKVLLICDFAAIEARGVAWCADELGLLDLFASGADVYCATATRIFGRDIAPAKNQPPERQVGKVTVLGAGYGMGPEKFGLYCGLQGIDLEKNGTSAEACIDGYRAAYPKIAGKPAGQINGRIYRRGGLWDQLGKAALSACGGEPTVAGKSRWSHDGEHLYCELPSGRRLTYRNGRIEDRVPGYVYTLGLPERAKATVVYDHPMGYESALFGGKVAENCLAADTRVITSNGIKMIVDVRPGDRVWDGDEWVRTDGCLYRGTQEVGSWLGVQLTADHLIYDGRKWQRSIESDESFTRCALKWAWSSIHLPSFAAGLGLKSTACADVSVVLNAWYSTGIYTERVAPIVRDVAPLRVRPNTQNSPQSSRTKRFGVHGYTDIPGSFHVATTRSVRPTRTTAVAGSAFTRTGGKIGSHSFGTSSPCRAGTTYPLTWIGSTITGGMNQAICGSPHASRTLPIDGTRRLLSTTELGTLSKISGNSSLPNGSLRTPSDTTSTTDERLTGLWRSTRRTAPVYDLSNCGLRNRFTILTGQGPVVVHNCVQAICRDLLAVALVRCEAEGLSVVLHVHDEIVCEVDEGDMESGLKRLAEIMSTPPEWATGFPISVEGFASPRYTKSALKGFPTVEATNGVAILH